MRDVHVVRVGSQNSSEQVVLQDEQGHDEDRDGEVVAALILPAALVAW